jgi:hypothetical protein
MRIKLDNKDVPYHWKERLISEGKIGGVFLVFLEGKNSQEIKNKAKKLKVFCGGLKNN